MELQFRFFNVFLFCFDLHDWWGFDHFMLRFFNVFPLLFDVLRPFDSVILKFYELLLIILLLLLELRIVGMRLS